MWLSRHLNTICWDSSLIEWSWHPCQRSVNLDPWVYFWTSIELHWSTCLSLCQNRISKYSCSVVKFWNKKGGVLQLCSFLRLLWIGGVAQVIECLLCNFKALSSNPSPTKNSCSFSESLSLYVNCRISLPISMKKPVGILMGIVLNL
jgi:hypothetical protein